LECDLDEDGIPDLCDSDIDGDGVENRLGMLQFEQPPSCLIDAENLDAERFADYQQHSAE
jgi:hypothetical protein